MKKTFIKSILRDMKNTIGKILSIMIMIALASLVIVGLNLTGPSMRKSLDKSLEDYKYPDISVHSTYFLNYEDEAILRNDSDIKDISLVKQVDLSNKDLLIRLKSYDENLKKSFIIEGRDLKKSSEIILDSSLNDKYKIGDIVKFSYIDDEDNILKNLSYEIVGFFDNPDTFMKDMNQISISGKKELDGAAFIKEENFLTDKYGEINISYKSLSNMDKTSKQYLNTIKEKKEDIEKDFNKRPEKLLDTVKTDAKNDIKKAENKIKNSKQKLDKGKKDLDDGKDKLQNGFDEYEKNKTEFYERISNAEIQLENSLKELNQGQEQLANAKEAFRDNQTNFEAEFSRKKSELDKNINELNLKFIELDKAKKEIDDNYDNLEKNREESYQKLDEAKASLDIEEYSIKEKEKLLEALNESSDETDKDGQIDQLKDEIKKEKELYQNALSEYEQNKANIDKEFYNQKFILDQSLGELRKNENELEAAKKELDEGEITLEKMEKSSRKELDDARISLENTEKNLNDGWNEYNQGKADLANEKINGENKLKEAYSELINKQKEYEVSKKDFDNKEKEANKKIKQGEEDISDGKKAILNLKTPEYNIDTIFENDGINTYYKNTLNMDKLSKVFPSFFYLVAMLVTLTTMKRYIDENRKSNATLKSLGFSNKYISRKFYIYGLTPTIIGSIIGVILGKTLILDVIFNAYSTGFKLSQISNAEGINIIIFSILLSTMLIALTIYITSKSVIKETPASLFKEKSPKIGSKIILEKIKFIWKRLSFMSKITARNLFRYKSRMFMTLFGIAGCTALIFFGFAMKDSVIDTSNIQKNEIQHYNAIAMLDDTKSKEDFDNYYTNISQFKNTNLYYKDVNISNSDKKVDAKLVVVKNKNDLSKFVTIRDKKKNPIELKNNEAILTEDAANELKIGKNSSIKLDIKGENDQLLIGDITENYVANYIYMTKDYYEKITGDKYKENASYIIGDIEKINKRVKNLDIVSIVIDNNGAYESMDSLLENLNLVITIITIISSMLAIVVLYNLTSINVSERKRELSTVKVLGFYSREVTAYIYREIFIMTILGIIFGYFLGILMFRYIISIVAPKSIMLSYLIHPQTYVISGLITILISIIILILVHNDLKKIDMAEAMSAGE